MIIEALIATINPIAPAYNLNADYSEKLPLAVVAERHEPVRTKAGIIGYNGSGLVTVITRNPETTLNLTNQVADALNALTDKTVMGTTFRMFRSGEISVDYDPDDNTYYSELQFTFKTKNL